MTTLRFALAAFCFVACASPALAQSRIVALSERDEDAYRDAFAAIDAGDWRGVSRALAHADDDLLEGVVRGRLLLARAYRPIAKLRLKHLYFDYMPEMMVARRALRGA